MQYSWKFLRLSLLLSAGISLISTESLAQNYVHNGQNLLNMSPIVNHKVAPPYAQPVHRVNYPRVKQLRTNPSRVVRPHHYQSNSHTKTSKKYGGLMGRLKGQRAMAHPQHMQRGQYRSNMQGPNTLSQAPMFQQWVDSEPNYLIQPQDQLDIVVSSAPELSRTLTVGPDGRVVMPMSAPIMAAGRSFEQVRGALQAELSKQLRDPTVAVTPRAYAPEQIFIGGQVGQPGTYTIPGRIGALEAVLMAGGMQPTAKTSKVAVLRRAPNGGMMMRAVDIKGGMKNIRQYNDVMQLRRGDIVFVPQNTLAEIGTFMQNFRNALPVDFNLTYQFGQNGGNGTTVLTP